MRRTYLMNDGIAWLKIFIAKMAIDGRSVVNRICLFPQTIPVNIVSLKIIIFRK